MQFVVCRQAGLRTWIDSVRNAGNRTELIVDNRVRLAIGGTAVVAASAAILLSAAVANAGDLVDVAGASIGASEVVVPSSQVADVATSHSSPRTDTTPVQVAQAPETGAVTVPAPDPFVVTGVVGSAVTVQQEDAIVTQVVETGSWDEVHAWASARGWSEEKIASWIARLEVKVDSAVAAGQMQSPSELTATTESADSGRITADVSSPSSNGNGNGNGNSVAPQIPAHAGKGSDPAVDPHGVGLKRGQSLDSPDQ